MHEPERIGTPNIVILDATDGHEYHVPVTQVTGVIELSVHYTEMKRCIPFFWRKRQVEKVRPQSRVMLKDAYGKAWGVFVPHTRASVLECIARNGATQEQLDALGYAMPTPTPPPKTAPVATPEPTPPPAFVVETKTMPAPTEKTEPDASDKCEIATADEHGDYHLKRTYHYVRKLLFRKYKGKKQFGMYDLMRILGFIQIDKRRILETDYYSITTYASPHFRKMMKRADIKIGKRRKFARNEVISYAEKLTRIGWMEAGVSKEGKNVLAGRPAFSGFKKFYKERAAKDAAEQHPQTEVAPYADKAVSPTPAAKEAERELVQDELIPETPSQRVAMPPEDPPAPNMRPVETLEYASALLDPEDLALFNAHKKTRKSEVMDNRCVAQEFWRDEVKLINKLRRVLKKAAYPINYETAQWKEYLHFLLKHGEELDPMYSHYLQVRFKNFANKDKAKK